MLHDTATQHEILADITQSITSCCYQINKAIVLYVNILFLLELLLNSK